MSETGRIFCEGTCHCGRIGARLVSTFDLPLRACQCSFCRRHGAGTVTDPNGVLSLYADESQFNRYKFDAQTADFLLCRTCGTYIAAMVSLETEDRATLNVLGIDPERFGGVPCEAVNYEGENADSRITRRLRSWTPTNLFPRRDLSNHAVG